MPETVKSGMKVLIEHLNAYSFRIAISAFFESI